MWCKRETFQWAFKAKAGKRGFQPQSKPPVHTGGFDYFRKSQTCRTLTKSNFLKQKLIKA
ncbi:hypothetical protein COD11_06780 [Bacillus sp. AFS040349]|nr:hypothetical protein COD11_06780 [Bacillus sp. AFS040349]